MTFGQDELSALWEPSCHVNQRDGLTCRRGEGSASLPLTGNGGRDRRNEAWRRRPAPRLLKLGIGGSGAKVTEKLQVDLIENVSLVSRCEEICIYWRH